MVKRMKSDSDAMGGNQDGINMVLTTVTRLSQRHQHLEALTMSYFSPYRFVYPLASLPQHVDLLACWIILKRTNG